MARRRSRPDLSPDRAAQAVSILIHEGKLKLQDVKRALVRREKMIRELRERLASLEAGASGVVRKSRRRVAAAPRKAARRISKAQRAAWQAQGRYMAAVRRLSKAGRAKIKAIREKSGVRAAIAAAKKIAATP